MTNKKRNENQNKEVISANKKVKLSTTPVVAENKKKDAAVSSQPVKQPPQQQSQKSSQATKQHQQQPSIKKQPQQEEEIKPKSIIKQSKPKEEIIAPPITKSIKKQATNKSFSQIIAVGCYENSIMGYEATYIGDKSQDENYEVDLKMVFGYSSHTGCIKGLASCKNVLVSSSTDETSKVYNLSSRSEVGQLQKHEGFITSMEFYKNTYLFAGSMDHTISVWRVSDWECLKVMSGPKGAINSISVHPSGKAALSVSKDRRLFLWDLTKGTSAHFLKFKTEAFNIQWSPSGEQYAVVFKDKVVVYDANTFEEISSFEFKLQVLSIKFFDDNTLLVGGEDKVVSFINLKTKKIVKVLEGHDNRIKAIDILKFKENDKKYVVTISSDGLILVWNTETKMPVGMAETGFRLTTLTIGHTVSNKDIGSDDEEEGDEEEEDSEGEYESDDEDNEAVANQTIKKMKLNVEMESDEEEDHDDEEEEEEYEEDDE